MAVRRAGPASDNRELLEGGPGFLIVDGTGKFDLPFAIGSCIGCMTERRRESIVVHNGERRCLCPSRSTDSDIENASRNDHGHVYVTNDLGDADKLGLLRSWPLNGISLEALLLCKQHLI